MDICNSQANKGFLKCKHHKEISPSFILLDGASEGDILLCNTCIEIEEKYDNQEFNKYQSIESLLIADDHTILPKWPPLKNQGILRQIRQYLDSDHNNKKQKETVIAYFDQLLSDVVKHIEEIKKQMLQKCSILPDLEEQLYQEYNSIAEKDKVKEVLMGNNSNFEEVNSKMREILKRKEEQKEQNEESLTTIFNSYLNNLKQFNEKTPASIMNQIFKLTKSISFFPELISGQEEQDLNQENPFMNQIVKAIENKTNFYSQQCIDEIKAKLNEWSFVFKESQVNKIYEDGHTSPLSFEELSELQLKKLEILIENMKSKEDNIELTPQVRLITDFINSPANYLIKDFSEYISLTMKQLSPFFDGFEVKTVHKENKIPINFRKISQEQVELIHKLVDKMSELKYDIHPKSINQKQLPRSHLAIQNLENKNMFYSLLPQILQQFPICELVVNKLNFNKGYYGFSQSSITIQNIDDSLTKFTKTNTNSYFINVASNQYLDKNKSYQIVFDINYQNQQAFFFIIGLSTNEKDNTANGDVLSFYTHNGGICTGQGMDKVKKGSRDNLKYQKQFQLNVNLSRGILEIGDYPNLNNILEVDDDKRAKLQQDTLYQIVFTIYGQNDELIIKNIQEINE